jgi:hypothetical protein
MPRPRRPPLRLKLCVLTGLPGSGKSSTARRIADRFDSTWTLLHADDFIGPTLQIHRPRPWPEVRRFRPRVTGWSAGWHLGRRRNVLVEGHFQDRRELDELWRGVRERYRGRAERRVVWIDDELERLVRRLVANPLREPAWRGRDRSERFRRQIRRWAIVPGIADARVERGDKSHDQLAEEVAGILGIPIGTK